LLARRTRRWRKRKGENKPWLDFNSIYDMIYPEKRGFLVNNHVDMETWVMTGSWGNKNEPSEAQDFKKANHFSKRNVELGEQSKILTGVFPNLTNEI
jgi:hypothetical protein